MAGQKELAGKWCISVMIRVVRSTTSSDLGAAHARLSALKPEESREIIIRK